MNKKVILFLLFAGIAVIGQAQETVYFNGLGRVIVTNDRLTGPVLDPDTTGSVRDTLNSRNGTGGYTLFDLGINAQPNENLRAHALLRVRNPFGGFFGDGSYLTFRQVRLDGILAKIVKYEIGDIDLSMTPYTLYNFDEIYHEYEADIFSIRRSIVQYENFNFGNNWRLQGVHASTTLNFEDYIDNVGISAFATRTRRTNFDNQPDRVLYGGEVDLVQSEHIALGGNYIGISDLDNTAVSPIIDYENNIITGDWNLSYTFAEDIEASILGEAGVSNYSYYNDIAETESSESDIFYDAGASVGYKPLDVKLFGTYHYVGSDFRSPGAQTRRIYPYPGQNGQVGVPDIFPTVGNNEQILRVPTLYDRFTSEGSSTNMIRNQTIMPLEYMAYLPIYNNIYPYGIATPNRTGITFGAKAGGDDNFYQADLIVDLLSEVQGEGVADERQFTGIRGGFSLDINRIIDWERMITVNAGARYENTTREMNAIDLTSTVVDAGLTVETINKLDLMGGLKYFTAEGNEFIAVRDPVTTIVNYQLYNANTNQTILAFGLRYRFSNNTFFTAQGHLVDVQYPENEYSNYDIKQLFLNYTMLF